MVLKEETAYFYEHCNDVPTKVVALEESLNTEDSQDSDFENVNETKIQENKKAANKLQNEGNIEQIEPTE